MPHSPLFSAQLNALKLRFLGTLSQRVLEFEQAKDCLERNVDVAGALEALRFGTHKIVGVAPTFGFDTLGQLAAISERETAACIAQGPRAESGLCASLERLISEAHLVLQEGNMSAPGRLSI